MVNKISNQTVHHQSATKCDSMLQDIKRLQACKAENTFCISDIAQKKNKITNIFKCRHGKNYSLENKMWRQTSGWVTCAKPSRRNPDPSVSHFLISLPFLHDFDVKSVILRFKVRKKRATKSMQLVLQHCYKASRKEMFSVLQPTSNLSCNKSSC